MAQQKALFGSICRLHTCSPNTHNALADIVLCTPHKVNVQQVFADQHLFFLQFQKPSGWPHTNTADKPAAKYRSVLVRNGPEMAVQKILRDAWDAGDEALHTALQPRPIVAFTNNRDLGVLLVKASH